MCCVKIHNKAVTWDENPWRDFWHNMLQFYGIFTHVTLMV